jgi:integrase
MRELRKHHAQEALNWFAQEGIEYKVVVRIKDDGSEEIIEDKKEAKKALEDGSAEEVTRYKKPCNSTVKNCRSALRLITKKAVENDVIGTDIFSGMRLPNATKVEESRDIVVPAVFNKVLESAKSDILLYTYLLLVWHTGIRPGEARALAWKNINFGEDYIYICEAEKYKRIGEGGIGETKTGKKRYVILVPELAEALRLLKKEQEAVLGTCKRVLMVLHGKNKGKLATEATLSNRLRNLLERHLIKNGVLNERDYFSIYNIRHTWITNGLKNKYTSSQMALASGNSVEMIETVYSKMNSRDVLEQMKKDMGLAQ